MKPLKVHWTSLLFIATNAVAAPHGGTGFSAPIFRPGSDNGCAEKHVSFVLAPDHSALSILRRDGYLIETPPDSKATIMARCRLDLVLTQASLGRRLLQLDLRGAAQKSAASELELRIDFGNAHHKAVYSRGQLLDGGPTFYRFQLANLPAGARQVKLDIMAKARSLNGKDTVQVSFDSVDVCLVDADSGDGCASQAASPQAGPAGQP